MSLTRTKVTRVVSACAGGGQQDCRKGESGGDKTAANGMDMQLGRRLGCGD